MGKLKSEKRSKIVFVRTIFIWIILVLPLIAIIAIAIYPEGDCTADVLPSQLHQLESERVLTLDEDDTLNVLDRDVMVDLATSFVPPETVAMPNVEPELPLLRSTRDLSDGKKQKTYRSRIEGVESWRSGGQRDQDKERVRKSQAQAMLSYMDQTADPCNDFYQYACGNWTQINPIPPDKAGFDVFEILREHLDIMLRDLLESEDDNNISNYKNALMNKTNITSKDGGGDNSVDYMDSQTLKTGKAENNTKVNGSQSAVAKVKALYRSCLNHDIVEERLHYPLTDLLSTLGGWPVVDPNWNESAFDWIELMAKLRLYNNEILLSQWVGPDIRNSEVFIVQFDQTTLGLPTRDYFLNPANKVYLDAYKEFISTVAYTVGGNNATIEKDTQDIIEFEKNLAEITYKPQDRQNISMMYNKISLMELKKTVPNIDFQRYLTIVLNRSVDEDEQVVIFALKYAQALSKLVEDFPPRTICNYLFWRFVRNRVNNLDDRFVDAKQRFYHALLGNEESPSRWKNCVTQVNSNMGMAVGALFVGKYFAESSKNDTLEMTRLIQMSFKRILNDSDYIDETTRLLAEQKIDAMLLRIGYPNFILDEDELDEYYTDIEIVEKKYFENTLNILKHLSKNEQDQVGKPVNKTIWNTAPAVVNAYYSRNKNQILFPAGILQPPFYHRHFPRSVNYGGIGMVIGHEIMHGFDDKGRLFDQNGNLGDWWQNNISWEFHIRAQCLISQYSQYVMSDVDMPLDGITTQGENIADNGGLKQAYNAYNTWLLNHDDLADEILEGVPASPRQLFFLNFAQIWCGNMRPEATRNKLKTAVHSPGRFRVIGTLSNLREFGEAFDCPIGSTMNPREKCAVY